MTKLENTLVVKRDTAINSVFADPRSYEFEKKTSVAESLVETPDDVRTRIESEILRLGRKKSVDANDAKYKAAEHIDGVDVEIALERRAGQKKIASATDGRPIWALDLPKLYAYRSRGPQLDQGSSSRCVVFGYCQAILSGKIKQSPESVVRAINASLGTSAKTLDEALWLAYWWCQDNDEWSGREPTYYGTSERAGAQFFRNAGYWPNFYWLESIEETARYLILSENCVPMASDWVDGFDRVDAKGFIRLTGAWRGGHQFLLDGVNIPQQFFRMRQSWGKDPYQWAKLSFDDARTLKSWGAGITAVKEVRLAA